jgi:ATP-dependent Clp protease ATP-binding subunit ClpC
MWKQLTQRARKAIFLAQEEAERLGYNHVGPEHLLLAITRAEDCIAARILERLGHDLGTVRAEVMKQLCRGSDDLEIIQLTSEAKQVIDLAFAECREMREDWVGTAHLLIGLARASGNPASCVLTGLGVGVPEIRIQLAGMHMSTLPFDNLEGCGTIPLMAV